MKSFFGNNPGKPEHGFYLGVALIILSACSTGVGQLFWKLSMLENSFLLLAIGALIYVAGTLLFIKGLGYGEFSVLYPMMGFSYVLSLLLGYFVLGEPISIGKIAGVGLIILGMTQLSASEKSQRK